MFKDGSAVTEGFTYQNIIGQNTPCHRDRSDLRAIRIIEIVDVKGKTVLDLGCNVGTMSEVIKNAGAREVIGIDYDEEAIRLGRKYYPDISFIEAEIDIDLIKGFPYYDVIVWTSQFMWMAKKYGLDYALEALWIVSQKCDVLAFETAGRNDGSAPMDIDQSEILKMLIKHTVFKDIVDTGPWWSDANDENWSIRNLFICRKPFKDHYTVLSSVTIPEKGIVLKDYSLCRCNTLYGKEIKEREVSFIRMLEGYPFVPRLIEDNDMSFKISYEGIQAKWIPEDQFYGILQMLFENNIIHRDIRPENLLWNGENIILIDWSWAIFKGEITNHSNNLGRGFKCPLGYNDEYSMRKVQKFLIDKEE